MQTSSRGHISQWSDSQLLGVILQQRHSSENSQALAETLLTELGSLHGVLNASQNAFCDGPKRLRGRWRRWGFEMWKRQPRNRVARGYGRAAHFRNQRA